MTPRFRQSYAKIFLTDCPALVKKALDDDSRNPTRAMQRGSLVDYLAFGQTDRFEIVDARYKSGPREGQPATDYTGREAREARDNILARGLTPALECELDALEPTATAIRERVELLAKEMAGGHPHDIVFQPDMDWTSGLGVECSGIPDVVVLVRLRDLIKVCTIDVKHTAFLQPKRFNSQVFTMAWDVQGHAYREGTTAWAEQETGLPAFHMDHIILASSSIDLGLPPCARTLDPACMMIGKKRWNKAQGQWLECLATGKWPGYSEEPATPPRYMMQVMEEFDPTAFAEQADEPIEEP